MSSTIGAISSYALSVQQMQVALIKNNIQAQKEAIDILLNNSRQTGPVSETLGCHVDVSI